MRQQRKDAPCPKNVSIGQFMMRRICMPCRASRGNLALANHPFWNIIMKPYHWHAARRREVVDDSEFAD
jgi:5-keto 4-deoxyuronate isomerase